LSNVSKENNSTNGCFLKNEHAVLAIFALSHATFSLRLFSSHRKETPVPSTCVLQGWPQDSHSLARSQTGHATGWKVCLKSPPPKVLVWLL